MSDIINSYVFKESDKLILEESQQKVVYQDLNSSFKDLEISLKANSKLELLVYNSESNIKCDLFENANLIIYNVSFQKDNYTFNLDINFFISFLISSESSSSPNSDSDRSPKNINKSFFLTTLLCRFIIFSVSFKCSLYLGSSSLYSKYLPK